MIRTRLRLKAFGLCVMAMGLIAAFAGSAQAETGANWMLNGSNVTSGLLPSVAMELTFGSASLLTEIGKAKVEYKCTGAELIGARLETEGKLTNGSKAKFTGCVTRLNGALSSVCVPKSVGQSNGTIQTQSLKGLMVLSLGQPVARIEPVFGTFVTILHGEECSLPESVPVMGSLFIQDLFALGKNETVSHSIAEEEFSSNLFVISNTIEHSAVIDGSGSAYLSGSHSGLKWNGLPG